ncbi:MAG TPA: alpha/beta hydrolase, partial [Actinomycetota bacterium]|nr:alpha/beta hydrolase [Actinomycetota bacterium]
PHSTKQIEDCAQWGLDGSVEALVLSDEEAPLPFASEEEARALCRRVRCPVLVIHGELDGCQPRERAVAVAELTGGTLVAFEDAGHLVQARHPVKVNRLLREFAATVAPPQRG